MSSTKIFSLKIFFNQNREAIGWLNALDNLESTGGKTIWNGPIE